MQCSIMSTRRCPSSYGDDGCGERLCARFESDDEAPWRDDLAEVDRNARAYGYEIGRGAPITAQLDATDGNPFLDRDWSKGIR